MFGKMILDAIVKRLEIKGLYTARFNQLMDGRGIEVTGDLKASAIHFG